MISEWLDIVNGAGYSMAERCLRMSRLLRYPRLDLDHYMQTLVDIGGAACAELKGRADRTGALNQIIYGRYGFGPDTQDYYDPRNNFLNEVIDRRCGIPITLAVLYADIARRAGLRLDIVGFPGHVLVRAGDRIIDPFYGGRQVTRSMLHDMLESFYGGPAQMRPEFLAAIGADAVLVRMARNLKNSYAGSYAYADALRCTDMILALEGHMAPADIRDKGLLEGKLKNYSESLRYLDRYVRLNPDGPDIDDVLAIIKSTRDLV